MNTARFARGRTEHAVELEKKNFTQRSLFACIEGGGQSWLCLVSEGVDPPREVDSCRFYTTAATKDGKTIRREAAEVINDCVQWLKIFESRHGKLAAIGIVSFGPCDLNHSSPTYGFITTTPKAGWQNTDVVGPFARAFKDTPIGFDTDVNMVAVSEYVYGGHGSISSAAYITVGTGIGVGMCTGGKAVHGLIHPEGGHIRAPRYIAPKQIRGNSKNKFLDADGVDKYVGNCLFHCLGPDRKTPSTHPCIEGMANSDAIADRLGIDKSGLKDVGDDNDVWDLEAYYLAQLCISITFLMSPEVIIIGGGVMNREILFPKIRQHFKRLLGGYFTNPQFGTDIEKYITRSRFDKVKGSVHAGVMGGLELARRVWELSDKYMISKQAQQIEKLNDALLRKDAESKTLFTVLPKQKVSFNSSPNFGMLWVGIGAGFSAVLTAATFFKLMQSSSNKKGA